MPCPVRIVDLQPPSTRLHYHNPQHRVLHLRVIARLGLITLTIPLSAQKKNCLVPFLNTKKIRTPFFDVPFLVRSCLVHALLFETNGSDTRASLGYWQT